MQTFLIKQPSHIEYTLSSMIKYIASFGFSDEGKKIEEHERLCDFYFASCWGCQYAIEPMPYFIHVRKKASFPPMKKKIKHSQVKRSQDLCLLIEWVVVYVQITSSSLMDAIPFMTGSYLFMQPLLSFFPFACQFLKHQ